MATTSSPIEIAEGRHKGWGWFDYAVIDEYGPRIGADGIAVYIALARFADNSTRKSFPATATIAERTGLSDRQVKRMLALLAEVGLITITRQFDDEGRQRTNLYTLETVPPVQELVGRGDTLSPSGVTHSQGEGDTQSPKQDSVNKTHRNKSDPPTPKPARKKTIPAAQQMIVTLYTGDIAQESALGAPSPGDMPAKPERKPLPKATAGFDWGGLWTTITAQQGYKPTWNYTTETAAVKRLLTAHPTATVDDFARFLAYVGTCWPFNEEPTRQPTFSRGAEHFGAWFTGTQPATATNGATHEHPQYTTAHDRNATSYANWAAALAEQAPPDPNPRLDRPDLRLIG